MLEEFLVFGGEQSGAMFHLTGLGGKRQRSGRSGADVESGHEEKRQSSARRQRAGRKGADVNGGKRQSSQSSGRPMPDLVLRAALPPPLTLGIALLMLPGAPDTWGRWETECTDPLGCQRCRLTGLGRNSSGRKSIGGEFAKRRKLKSSGGDVGAMLHLTGLGGRIQKAEIRGQRSAAMLQ